MASSLPRVVVRVEREDPEAVGTIQASEHPELRPGEPVRAVYFQQVEATAEYDVYRLEGPFGWYVGYPDEHDSEWSRRSIVVAVVGPWPDDWDDGPAFRGPAPS